MIAPTEWMSIGALAKATGVPPDTLRTWERRYGFPSAERTDSGHRRYSLRTLERLRLVVRALELGHRPSDVLVSDESSLHALLSASAPGRSARTVLEPSADGEVDGSIIERWLEHVLRFEGRALERELRVALGEYGSLPFLERLVGPFLGELGERWARGALAVRHEHFASERLHEFLAQAWRPLSDAATGATAVCATPAGEHHTLGLHMASLALALHNARIVFLGADAPFTEIALAVAHHSASAVVLSVALGCDRARLEREIAGLRAALPEAVPILAGGRGVQPTLPSTHTVTSLHELVALWPTL